MINFSVSRPPRALILGGQVKKKKKKKFCPFRFCQCWVRGGRFPKFPPFVQFFTPTRGGCDQKLSVFLFSLQAIPQDVRFSNTDSDSY